MAPPYRTSKWWLVSDAGHGICLQKLHSRFVLRLAFTNDIHLLYLLSNTSQTFTRTPSSYCRQLVQISSANFAIPKCLLFKQYLRSMFRPTSRVPKGLFLVINWYEASDTATPWTLTGNICWWRLCASIIVTPYSTKLVTFSSTKLAVQFSWVLQMRVLVSFNKSKTTLLDATMAEFIAMSTFCVCRPTVSWFVFREDLSSLRV